MTTGYILSQGGDGGVSVLRYRAPQPAAAAAGVRRPLLELLSRQLRHPAAVALLPAGPAAAAGARAQVPLQLLRSQRRR